jgi:hypothetical protein
MLWKKNYFTNEDFELEENSSTPLKEHKSS